MAAGETLDSAKQWELQYGGRRAMGWHEAETSVVAAARPSECFDALIDCIGMPEWQVGLRACDVLSRDEQGRPKDVAFEVDAIVKTMKYTLRHSYDEPHRITGEYLDGDFKDFTGEWLMEETATGTTRVTFKVGIDPGAWSPGMSHEPSTSRSCASPSSD